MGCNPNEIHCLVSIDFHVPPLSWCPGTTKSVKGKPALIKIQGQGIIQRTNDPVNAHLLREPCISTKHTKPKNKVKIDLDFQYSLTFIYW